MKKQITFCFVVAALCLISLASCAAVTQPPKPTPTGRENEELGYLVGKWTLDGKLESHPKYSSATVVGTMDCQWFDGHFAVLCQVEQQSNPAGLPTKALRIFGYSPEAQAYTSWGLTNTQDVATDVALGSFQNGNWMYAGEQKMNGHHVKFRESFTKISSTSFTLSQQSAVDGGAWRELATATFTKTP